MTHGPRPGDFITPQVRLARPLAEGGMGRLWVAEHLGLNTEVVVKLMTEEMAARADGLSRFRREAAAIAAIKSPHVVQIFDHGVTQDGVPYIVMELLEGEDLAVTLARVGRLAPAVVVELIGQVGKALYRAHQAGIIHRDIKPDNIFLCAAHDGPSDLFVKLLDFGTAKRADVELGATSPGQIMGTPYYMSPEQIVGAAQDARSDIWSLGVVAFEALTDRRPFEGSSLGAVTLAIHSAPPKLTSIDPSLPPAVDAWFARACAQSPADRFANAREASVAFAAAMTGQTAEQVGAVYFPPAESARRADLELGEAKTITRSAPPLTATLSDPAVERRNVTRVAAGVGVVAILVMIGIVFGGRSGPDGDTAAKTEPSASPPPPPAETHPTPSAAPSLATIEPTATPSVERRHRAPPATAPSRRRKHDAGAASPDDDLARLSNIPSSTPAPAPAPAPTPTPSEAPEPPPKIDVPPPAPAPDP